jgi:hypothetical protein
MRILSPYYIMLISLLNYSIILQLLYYYVYAHRKGLAQCQGYCLPSSTPMNLRCKVRQMEEKKTEEKEPWLQGAHREKKSNGQEEI